MRSLQLAFRRISFRWRRAQLERELIEEIELHAMLKQQETADLSRKQMGNVTLAKEECRDMWSFLGPEHLFQDLRYAIRMFIRTPVFTAVAIVSLALGIGGNTAMFSLVHALLLKPLPYSDPDRLVRVTGIYPRAAIRFFQERSRTLEIAAVSTGDELNLTGQELPARVMTSAVSANFFDVLGASVADGRGFRGGEDLPGRDGVVLISNSLWKRRFASDPAILGRLVMLNGVHREIVGVMPAGFSYPSAGVQMWIPLRLDPSNFFEYWAGEFVPLIARLRPGATMPAAQDEVRSLLQQFRKTFPYPMARDWNADVTVIPLQRDIVGDVRGRLIILLTSVAVLLLIACVNVASLLLARATTRRKEIALRAALGAGRVRLIRQLLTESITLALAAAVCGIGLGIGALSLFKSLLPAATPGLAEAAVDWPVVAVMAGVALFTGLAFGLSPALSISQVDLTETMKTGSQRSTSGLWVRLRSVLVAAEVALTVILMVGAGLLLKSLYELSNIKAGFEPKQILTVRISPDQSYCVNRSACVALYDRLLRGAHDLTGVTLVAVANSVPLEGELPTIPVDVQDHPKTADHPAPMLWFGAVSDDYLRALNIPLLAGRLLTRADAANADRAIVISASTAKRFWPHESAIGKHLKSPNEQQWRTIVGVVGDVKQYTLTTGLPAWVAGAVYIPYAQSAREDGQIPAAMTLLVKATAPTPQLARELQRIAQDEAPSAPVDRVQRLDDIMYESLASFRSVMRVFLSFAVTAMLLASIGIYGLMSYWVSQRTYEISLRVAIGATRRKIVSMILAQGVRVSLYGIFAGILAALLLTRFLSSLLYGVAATDVLTFASVTTLVLVVGVIATAVPAWRAARIDPAKSLRAE